MIRNGRLAPAYRRRMAIVLGLSLLPMAILIGMTAGEIAIKILEQLP